MTVFDAQAVVAALLGEPAAEIVEALLLDQDDPAHLSAANLAEILDVLVRRVGLAVEDVEEKLRWLIVGGLRVVPVDEPTGSRAGRLRAQHYDRTVCPLSLADCIALATAMELDQPLATADPALLAVAQRVGVDTRPLPDSSGRLPGRQDGPERPLPS